jgi:hypothetical protein
MRRQVFIACGFASHGAVGYDYRECTAFAWDYLDVGGERLDDAVNEWIWQYDGADHYHEQAYDCGKDCRFGF